MPQIKLTYFDFDGGRGESVRLALHAGGIAFADERVPGPEWPARRAATPYRAMPLLEVDGEVFSQSNTILRYVGRLGGLLPKGEVDLLRCDELMDAVEDLTSRIGVTMSMEGEARQKAREKLAADAIPCHLEQFNARLEAGGGQWFFEDRLTIADLKVFPVVRWLASGALDHVPNDLPSKHGPLLLAHGKRVHAHPKVADWYAKRKAA